MNAYLLRPEAMDFAPGPHKTVIPTYGASEVAPDGTRRTLCECGHDSADAAVLCASRRFTPALARVAFDAYGASTGGKTWDGKPIPAYDVVAEKTPHVARAWEAAVAAVLKASEPRR